MEDRKYVRYHAEEWSALYIDGKLVTIGDSYLSDEKIAQILGVEEIHSDAFLRGGDSREGAALTLDAIEDWEEQQQIVRSQSERLREQARALFAEADARDAEVRVLFRP